MGSVGRDIINLFIYPCGGFERVTYVVRLEHLFYF